MRTCKIVFGLVVFIAGIPAIGLQAQQPDQRQKERQQERLQQTLLQAPAKDPVRAPQQRQATPAERAAMLQAMQQQPTKPQLPEGFPLPAEQEKYINDLLDYWQQSSQQVKRSECEFTRREYDPEYCNFRDPRNNHLVPFNISLGKIHFASPDKGRYETEQVWTFKSPPEKEGEEPNYEQLDDTKNRDKWICDGRAIYQFDFASKRLNESKIPPAMQGKGLVNSPLPFFLFGADKDLILERYWVRPVTPEGVTDAYWLEAYPKRVSDARNYKKLDIIIARDDFLPASLVMYASNYDAVKNPAMMSFEFTKRKINSQLGAIRTAVGELFGRPITPIGWKRVELKGASPATAGNTIENQSLKR